MSNAATNPPDELDDFGLPIRKYVPPGSKDTDGSESTGADDFADAVESVDQQQQQPSDRQTKDDKGQGTQSKDDGTRQSPTQDAKPTGEQGVSQGPAGSTNVAATAAADETVNKVQDETKTTTTTPTATEDNKADTATTDEKTGSKTEAAGHSTNTEEQTATKTEAPAGPGHTKNVPSMASEHGQLSGFSHQKHDDIDEKKDDDDADGGWQEMPAFAPYDMYDDDDRLIARELNEEDVENNYGYAGMGSGAGRGYTRVQMDEDAQSANSMDDNTQYLFKEGGKSTAMIDEDDDEARDAMSQMQATKDLLTEGQRIAYVGIVRLEIAHLVDEGEKLESTRKIRKMVATASEALRMWGQKMMMRLYSHMEISDAEQIMIEQLAEHGVVPADLVPALHTNATVKNPMAARTSTASGPPSETDIEEKISELDTETTMDPRSPRSVISRRQSLESAARTPASPSAEARVSKDDNGPSEEKSDKQKEAEQEKKAYGDDDDDEEPAAPPPPYEAHEGDDAVPEAQMPSQLPTTAKIDIDLRWTVLCDLFLILIADSVYDARSRVLLERVGKSLDVPWIDICRFEKRVTDAIEMQQAADRETWNEDDNMENRRKGALKKRYMMLGLATVGGGLVIGLSAGLLAPVIGAGLAAGFTTIGVAGTGSFLGGVGGAAVITSGAVASGSYMGAKAANKRTGAVKTFEYRPLHNNKRVNLIVTVSGWLTGKVDDVRLPFSTVDPTMGDIYSILWEPELLQSMGATIRILATEALTQSIQQVLGSTILAALMGALQLPIILAKLSYLIDNPWAVSLDRATAAGKILADSLIERNLGTRPITLVGYSLGSRVIFSALQELAKRGAYGVVQNVYMFGSPLVVKKEEYLRARTVVAGRFVNGYNRNDWILGYLFRLTNGGIRRVAGLAAAEDLPWLENIDVTDLVKGGHMDYRKAIPRLLKHCGWSVESEEFTEIEDPDPDNHEERQRELINEIEEARKELEKEGGKSKRKSGGGRFSLFGRRKKADRQEWELYEDGSGSKKDGTASPSSPAAATASGSAAARELDDRDRDAAYQGALFDVDAIRAELARDAAGGGHDKEDEELLQVREIKSTLPPMKLDLSEDKAKSHGYSPAAGAGASASTSAIVPTGHDRPDDGIHMTFDTAFDEPASSKGKTAARDNEEDDGQHGRMPPRAQTLPPAAMSNPWGDPDDDDFGQEKEEISMTFA